MNTRTLLFCEDNKDVIDEFSDSLEQELKNALTKQTSTEWHVEKAENYKDALDKARVLQDDDIISLDSILSATSVTNEGERVLAALRERNCKCFAIWHSSATSVPPWAEQCCYKMPGWSDFQVLAEKIAGEYSRWQTIRNTITCRQPNFTPAQNLTAIYLILKAMEIYPNKRAEIKDGWKKADSDWRQQLWNKAWQEFIEEPKNDADQWHNLQLPTFDENGALVSGNSEFEQTDASDAVRIIKSVLPR